MLRNGLRGIGVLFVQRTELSSCTHPLPPAIQLAYEWLREVLPLDACTQFNHTCKLYILNPVIVELWSK